MRCGPVGIATDTVGGLTRGGGIGAAGRPALCTPNKNKKKMGPRVHGNIETKL